MKISPEHIFIKNVRDKVDAVKNGIINEKKIVAELEHALDSYEDNKRRVWKHAENNKRDKRKI